VGPLVDNMPQLDGREPRILSKALGVGEGGVGCSTMKAHA